jgi:CheY-like chemotaxis protein
MQPANISAPAPLADPSAGAAPKAILVIEDDPGVRSLVNRMLGRLGYRVHCAVDADEGLAFIASTRGAIDLVLCDVVMPGRSGRDVVSRIQADSPCTRSLFMSGHMPDSLVANGTLEEGRAFLHKPFTPSELAQKVREVLGA